MTEEARRLFWNLQGPLASAISVLHISRDEKIPREPYAKQTSAGTELHPIAHTALTEPKVSSLSVVVQELEDWADDWHAFFFCYQDRELGDLAANNPEDGRRSPNMPVYDDENMEPPQRLIVRKWLCDDSRLRVGGSSLASGLARKHIMGPKLRLLAYASGNQSSGVFELSRSKHYMD